MEQEVSLSDRNEVCKHLIAVKQPWSLVLNGVALVMVI